MIEMGFEVLETKIIPRYKSVYNQSNSSEFFFTWIFSQNGMFSYMFLDISNDTKTIKVIDYYEPIDSRQIGINVHG